MEIALAKTELADVFLLKHGPEPVNIEARDSICAFRGIHFLEENCFVLGFEMFEACRQTPSSLCDSAAHCWSACAMSCRQFVSTNWTHFSGCETNSGFFDGGSAGCQSNVGTSRRMSG